MSLDFLKVRLFMRSKAFLPCMVNTTWALVPTDMMGGGSRMQRWGGEGEQTDRRTDGQTDGWTDRQSGVQRGKNTVKDYLAQQLSSEAGKLEETQRELA